MHVTFNGIHWRHRCFYICRWDLAFSALCQGTHEPWWLTSPGIIKMPNCFASSSRPSLPVNAEAVPCGHHAHLIGTAPSSLLCGMAGPHHPCSWRNGTLYWFSSPTACFLPAPQTVPWRVEEDFHKLPQVIRPFVVPSSRNPAPVVCGLLSMVLIITLRIFEGLHPGLASNKTFPTILEPAFQH